VKGGWAERERRELKTGQLNLKRSGEKLGRHLLPTGVSEKYLFFMGNISVGHKSVLSTQVQDAQDTQDASVTKPDNSHGCCTAHSHSKLSFFLPVLVRYLFTIFLFRVVLTINITNKYVFVHICDHQARRCGATCKPCWRARLPLTTTAPQVRRCGRPAVLSARATSAIALPSAWAPGRFRSQLENLINK
jgi:hypothetical protein